MSCEKHGPRASVTTKELGLRSRFLSTESLGPCFSHGMGDHDQILQQNTDVFWYILCVVINNLELMSEFGM